MVKKQKNQKTKIQDQMDPGGSYFAWDFVFWFFGFLPMVLHPSSLACLVFLVFYQWFHHCVYLHVPVCGCGCVCVCLGSMDSSLRKNHPLSLISTCLCVPLCVCLSVPQGLQSKGKCSLRLVSLCLCLPLCVCGCLAPKDFSQRENHHLGWCLSACLCLSVPLSVCNPTRSNTWAGTLSALLHPDTWPMTHMKVRSAGCRHQRSRQHHNHSR